MDVLSGLVRGGVPALAAFNPLVVNGTLAATASANALTFALKTLAGADPSAADPVYALFPNSSGGWSVVKISAALSLTVASGSTLGVPASTSFNIWCALFFDGTSTVSIGVVNCVDSSNNILAIGAHGFATTVAEGGNADNAHTWYTSSALTGKPYVTLGRVEYTSGLGTPGTWSGGPNNIVLHGAGGKLPGDVLRTMTDTANAVTTTTGTTYVTTGLSASIALSSAANIVEYTAQGSLGSFAANFLAFAKMHRDSTAIGAAAEAFGGTSTVAVPCTLHGFDRPNSTSSIAYNVRIRASNTSGSANFPTTNDGGGQSGAMVVKELQG